MCMYGVLPSLPLLDLIDRLFSRKRASLLNGEVNIKYQSGNGYMRNDHARAYAPVRQQLPRLDLQDGS